MDIGEGRSEADRKELQEDYPAWRVDLDHTRTLFCAWLPSMPRNQNGLLVLRDGSSWRGLRQRMEVFSRVWNDTYDRERAEAAADDLKT